MIGGVPFKAMVDIAADDKTVDFKTVANFEDMWLDGQKVSFIRILGLRHPRSDLSRAPPPDRREEAAVLS